MKASSDFATTRETPPLDGSTVEFDIAALPWLTSDDGLVVLDPEHDPEAGESSPPPLPPSSRPVAQEPADVIGGAAAPSAVGHPPGPSRTIVHKLKARPPSSRPLPSVIAPLSSEFSVPTDGRGRYMGATLPPLDHRTAEASEPTSADTEVPPWAARARAKRPLLLVGAVLAVAVAALVVRARSHAAVAVREPAPDFLAVADTAVTDGAPPPSVAPPGEASSPDLPPPNDSRPTPEPASGTPSAPTVSDGTAAGVAGASAPKAPTELAVAPLATSVGPTPTAPPPAAHADPLEQVEATAGELAARLRSERKLARVDPKSTPKREPVVAARKASSKLAASSSVASTLSVDSVPSLGAPAASTLAVAPVATTVQPLTTYSYASTELFQVAAATKRVTDIVLQAGEKLVARPTAGDASLWVISVVDSVQQGQPQQHVYVKPLRPDLSTSLTLTTDRRNYHIALNSSSTAPYMAAVEWSYPDDVAARNRERLERATRERHATTEIADVRSLHFDYSVRVRQGEPSWKPVMVFDDGAQTFIRFPTRISPSRAPLLYVLRSGSAKSAQYINFRIRNDLFVLDRRIDVAELRLGDDVVRIARKVTP